jgi:hypothetical protein
MNGTPGHMKIGFFLSEGKNSQKTKVVALA